MKRYGFIIVLTCVLCFISYLECGEKQKSKFFDIEYASRRNLVKHLLDSNSAAVLKANEYKVRSNDINYPYRQESNFLYLSGITEPNHLLLITNRNVSVKGGYFSTLLFAPLEDNNSIFESGDEIILDKSKFFEIFSELLNVVSTVYISAPDYRIINDWLNNKLIFTEKNARNELRGKYPHLQLKYLSSLISRLREVKSEKEVEYLQKAVDITADGILRAIKNCKPGMFEYQIQAEIEYEFKRQGSTGVGFPLIIASGENALTLHYDKNTRRIESGDLLLIDVGAEYNWYSADISRTIPVSGKFTKAQKELYSVVLKAQKETIKLIKPGVTLRDLNNKTEKVIADAGYKKFIKHSVSHHIGLDVHDVWWSDTLKAGMVITVEPGIYIPKEANLPIEYCGIGIRIEDVVLVTSDGFRILSDKIPKEIEQIEKLMSKN